jgi:hypothetical protein
LRVGLTQTPPFCKMRHMAKKLKKGSRVAKAKERTDWRNASVEEKFRQFAALMATAEPQRLSPEEEAEVAEVRERWNRLRKIYGVFK